MKYVKYFCIITIMLLSKNNLMANAIDSLTAKTIGANYFIQNNLKGINLHWAFTAKDSLNNNLLYIYNCDNNNGFIIVSATDNVTPILGYNLSGHFNKLKSSKQFLFWLDNYQSQISYAIQHHIQADKTIQAEWKKYSNISYNIHPQILGASKYVLPLLSTTWDQLPFYNDSCPQKSVTGCVATTMAQIMKYWSYPMHGIGITPSFTTNTNRYNVPQVVLDSVYYNWSKMPQYLDTSNSDVAQLMYDCGASVQMDYTPTSSGAYVLKKYNYAASAEVAYYKYFDYDSASIKGLEKSYFVDSAWVSLIKNELDNGRPVQYAGFSFFSGGHTWVCDGYDQNNLFHMNWGWNNIDDGYYRLSDLTPAPIFNGFYSNSQQALIGIQPKCIYADLHINSLNASSFNPSLGDSIITKFIVRNIGQQTAGMSNVGIYLQTTSTFDSVNAIKLKSINIASINAGKLDSLNVKVQIPNYINPGHYYLFVRANDLQNVMECNRNNNAEYIELFISSIPCAAPVNDEYCGAIQIPYTFDSCVNNTTGRFCGSTPSFIHKYLEYDTINKHDDVFYQFTATESNVTITINPSINVDVAFCLLSLDCSDPQKVYLYGPKNSYTNFNNAHGIGKTEIATYEGIAPGKTYYVRVWNMKPGWGSDSFNICIKGHKCVQIGSVTNPVPGSTNINQCPFLTTLTPTLSWDTTGVKYRYPCIKVIIKKPPYDTASIVDWGYSYYSIYSNLFQFAVDKNTLKSGVIYQWYTEANTDCSSTCKGLSDILYFKIDTSSCSVPKVQASNIWFSNITPYSMKIHWTKGSSDRSIVNINCANQFSPPLYGDTSKPNKQYSVYFPGYCFSQVVYNGTADSCIVTGLSPLTNYCVRIYAANCYGSGTNYDTVKAFNNPNCQSTCIYPTEPDVTANVPTTYYSNFNICRGDTIKLLANSTVCNGCIYVWNTGDTATSIKVSPKNLSYYSVKAINSCGISYDRNISVTVDTLATPSLYAYYDKICKGQSTTLYVSNDCYYCNYYWSDGAVTNGGRYNITPIKNTTYTVTYNGSCGRRTSSPITIYVDTAIINPSFVSGINPTKYDTSFKYFTDSIPSINNYYWSTMSGHGATLNTTTNKPNNNITWKSTGFLFDTIYVNLMNGCGYSRTFKRAIVLPPCTPPQLPKIWSSSGSYSLCNGDQMRLYVVPESNNFNYTWSPSQSNNTGIEISPNKTTNYSVVVSNKCKPDAVSSQTITVYDRLKPQLILSEVCNDSTVTIIPNFTNGGDAPKFHWYKYINGNWHFLLDTTNILILNSPDNGTQYRCVGFSNENCVTTDTASAVITINCSKFNYENIVVYPNPNNGKMGIRFNLQKPKSFSYVVYNSVGQSVYHSEETLVYRSFDKMINLGNLPTDTYYMVVSIDGKKQSIPIYIFSK